MNAANIMNKSRESKLFVREFSYVHKLWTRIILWTKADTTKNAEVAVDHLRNDRRDHENPGPGNHTFTPYSALGNLYPSTYQAPFSLNWLPLEPELQLLSKGLWLIANYHLHCIMRQCRWLIGTTAQSTYLAQTSGCPFPKAVFSKEEGRCITCGRLFSLGLGFGLQ